MTNSIDNSIPIALQKQPTGPNIGKLLVSAGKLSESEVEQIRAEQQTHHLRFGEAAIRLGLLKEEDILRALSRQFDYSIPIENEEKFSHELFAIYAPYSVQGEKLRALRSELMLMWFDENRKELSFTSDHQDHGCSQLVANLAIMFSQLGDRTLLIDANLREPQQHRLFNVDNQLGLSSFLGGRIQYSDAIKQVKSFANLFILCAGAVPPNPQELLSRGSFIQMQEAIRTEYDIILYDTSPALINSDAQIVVDRVDGCVLVVRRHKTKMAQALFIKKQLTATGANLLGVVIN